MNTRERLFWILGGTLLLVGALVTVWFGLQGQLPWQRGEVYSDPQGRFTLASGSGWEQVSTDQPYMQFHLAEPPMTLYMLVIPTPTVKQAFAQAADVVGMDPALLTGGTVAQIQDWEAYSAEDSAGLIYGLAGQVVEDNAYVLVVEGEQPGESVDSPVVIRAMQSLKIAGKKEIVIKGYADVETLVRGQVDSHAGSISVAVLHGDQIVYTYAYGDANPLAGVPAGIGTIYRFGSMTKPFTATALMQLVEQGRVNLDAWPGEYVPEFPKTWKVAARQPIDLTVEVVDRADRVVRLPLSSFSYLQPQIVMSLMKAPAMNVAGPAPSEPIFESFQFPLAAFVKADPAFDPASLTTVRFIFDRTPAGVILLDDLGFRK